jgi:hypothetical protein
MIKVRFYTLSGKFAFAHESMYQSKGEAVDAIIRYATEAGYTNVKEIDDEDMDFSGSSRFTAKTPNGRAGRNIAHLETGW